MTPEQDAAVKWFAQFFYPCFKAQHKPNNIPLDALKILTEFTFNQNGITAEHFLEIVQKSIPQPFLDLYNYANKHNYETWTLQVVKDFSLYLHPRTAKCVFHEGLVVSKNRKTIKVRTTQGKLVVSQNIYNLQVKKNDYVYIHSHALVKKLK